MYLKKQLIQQSADCWQQCAISTMWSLPLSLRSVQEECSEAPRSLPARMFNFARSPSRHGANLHIETVSYRAPLDSPSPRLIGCLLYEYVPRQEIHCALTAFLLLSLEIPQILVWAYTSNNNQLVYKQYLTLVCLRLFYFYYVIGYNQLNYWLIITNLLIKILHVFYLIMTKL